MSKKDRKKKKSSGSSGGKLSSFRSGFKGLVGTGGKQKKKESLASKIITWVLVAAAVALVAYRIYQRM